MSVTLILWVHQSFQLNKFQSWNRIGVSADQPKLKGWMETQRYLIFVRNIIYRSRQIFYCQATTIEHCIIEETFFITSSPHFRCFYNNEKYYFVCCYWTGYFSIMSKLNHLFNAEKNLCTVVSAFILVQFSRFRQDGLSKMVFIKLYPLIWFQCTS